MLRGSVLAGAAAAVGATQGCAGPAARVTGPRAESATATALPEAETRASVLVAYFSRPGENYHLGDRRQLRTGNTKVLARMVSARLACDVHEILAADPYPDGYDDTVARNVREQEADARPALASRQIDLAAYDVVLLGSPIWNVRPPMLMHTFAEALDFTGTLVHPFTTHAMSGLGTAAREYAASCRGARIREGLAVLGEEVTEAGSAVDSWLRRIGLLANPALP